MHRPGLESLLGLLLPLAPTTAAGARALVGGGVLHPQTMSAAVAVVGPRP